MRRLRQGYETTTVCLDVRDEVLAGCHCMPCYPSRDARGCVVGSDADVAQIVEVREALVIVGKAQLRKPWIGLMKERSFPTMFDHR
ncbi:MAG TPA: hypothetical protein VGW38_22960 [Chloroflexota bacterium]|nr:hypothetical protein [Chloroflexota bacterium]